MRPEDWQGWGASALLILTPAAPDPHAVAQPRHQSSVALAARRAIGCLDRLYLLQQCWATLVFIVTNSLILAIAVFVQAACGGGTGMGNKRLSLFAEAGKTSGFYGALPWLSHALTGQCRSLCVITGDIRRWSTPSA